MLWSPDERQGGETGRRTWSDRKVARFDVSPADLSGNLSDGVKCGTPLETMPAAVTEFMIARMEEDDTHEDTKEATVR